jgi:hypothetical protein
VGRPGSSPQLLPRASGSAGAGGAGGSGGSGGSTARHQGGSGLAAGASFTAGVLNRASLTSPSIDRLRLMQLQQLQLQLQSQQLRQRRRSSGQLSRRESDASSNAGVTGVTRAASGGQDGDDDFLYIGEEDEEESLNLSFTSDGATNPNDNSFSTRVS